ncbi:hypothetical protein D3C86_1774290 [compost metagenome]
MHAVIAQNLRLFHRRIHLLQDALFDIAANVHRGLFLMRQSKQCRFSVQELNDFRVFHRWVESIIGADKGFDELRFPNAA